MSTATEVELATVKAKLELLEIENKKREAGVGQQKSWVTSVTQFLVVPGAILALVLQFTQVSGNTAGTEKTAADTENIRVQTLKTRADLQKELDDLAKVNTNDLGSYKAQVEQIVPKLEEASQKLKDIESETSRQVLLVAFAKFIVLWIILTLVGLMFDVFQQIWGYFMAGFFFLSRRSTWPDDEDREARRRRERLQNLVQIAFAFGGSLPNILRWSISLAIFTALFIPLFNEIAVGLGSSVQFADVWSDIRALRIDTALVSLRQILFS